MARYQFVVAVAISLLASSFARSEGGEPAAARIVAPAAKPEAPCSDDPYPDYPAIGQSPEIILWTARELGSDWTPPPCADWPKDAPDRVVALSAHIRDSRDMDAMLSDIGAVSRLDRVRYWSVSDGQWDRLFTKASALDSSQPETLRADFAARELRASRDLYFLAADNRSGVDTVWHLRVRQLQRDRIVFETSNVTPLKWWFVPIIGDGGVETTYFLDREPQGAWRVYTLTRVLFASSAFAYFVPDASYINRALALYRHFAGLPDEAASELGKPISESAR